MRNKITTLLSKLKVAHDVYRFATEKQKNTIFEKLQPTFDELVSLGYSRPFVETLLMFGKEFLLSSPDRFVEDVIEVFHGVSGGKKRRLTWDEMRERVGRQK